MENDVKTIVQQFKELGYDDIEIEKILQGLRDVENDNLLTSEEVFLRLNLG